MLLRGRKMEQDRNKIFMENQKIVYFTFNKYFSRFLRYKDDLLQEGFIGLLKCIDKFNSERGEFSTFATTAVKNHMAMWLKKETRGLDKKVYLEDMGYEDDEDKFSFIALGDELDDFNYDKSQVKSVFSRALDCFNEPYRKTILYWAQGGTLSNFAKKLNCTRQYVCSIIDTFKEIFKYIWENGCLPPPKKTKVLNIC